jgi:hypothetical protein
MTTFNSYLENELNTLDANNDLYALLISDDGTFGRGNTMSDIAALEISTTNGYSRQQQTFGSSASEVSTGKFERVGDTVTFTASGGSMDEFSHIVWVVGANSTQGDTTGNPVAFESVNGGTPVTLSDTQSYDNTRTFTSEDI